MKKLLILTTFLSSLIMSSVAYAKWTEVGKSVNGTTYYIDFERIKKHDGKVYFWRLTDFLKPNYGDLSARTYVEAECGPFRLRNLNYKFYEGPMASGKISTSKNTPNADWTYPGPGSVKEAIVNAVCNYKSMQ